MTLDGLHNIRDLGGLPLASGGQTGRGRIYRGCAMAGLSETGQGQLLALGIRTAIDLRSDSERAETPSLLSDQSGVLDLHIPVFADLAPIYKLGDLKKNFSLSYRYGQALDKAGPRFAAALRAVANAPEGPVYFHCTLGKDRTGIMAALALRLAGVATAEIVADYTQTVALAPDYLALIRRHSLARGTEPEFLDKLLDAPAEAMEATLARLDQDFGGAEAYLARAGLTPEEMARIAARLTEG